MNEILIGGVLGTVATLLGVLVQHLLGERTARRMREEAAVTSLDLVFLELESQRHRLDVNEGPVLLERWAYDAAAAKGDLLQLPADTLARVIEMYTLIYEINEEIRSLRSAADAIISSGEIERGGGLVGFRTNIDKLRTRALDSLGPCLEGIARFTDRED